MSRGIDYDLCQDTALDALGPEFRRVTQGRRIRIDDGGLLVHLIEREDPPVILILVRTPMQVEEHGIGGGFVDRE